MTIIPQNWLRIETATLPVVYDGHPPLQCLRLSDKQMVVIAMIDLTVWFLYERPDGSLVFVEQEAH